MATSGAITAWLRDLFGGIDYAELVGLAEQSPPGSGGLLMLPYFAGERTPIMDPDARGTVLGLTLSHGRGDLYRAALEATGFGVRHNVETFLAAGGDVRRVVAVGGGTQGRLWMQIVSDITGLTQIVPAQTVGASYGGALLAAQTQSAVSIRDWNPVRDVVEPNPDTRGLYDDLYGRYRDLYTSTRELNHALATHQKEHR
jgi:xylulokinase